MSSSIQCEAYQQQNEGSPHLTRCQDQAQHILTVQTPVEVYTTCRCQGCRDLLFAKVVAGDPLEVLDEDVLRQLYGGQEQVEWYLVHTAREAVYKVG